MACTSRIVTRIPSLMVQRPCLHLNRSFTTTVTRQAEQWPQSQPLGEYYDAILRTPAPRNAEERLETLSKDADPATKPAEKLSGGLEEPQGKKKPGRKPKADDQPKASLSFDPTVFATSPTSSPSSIVFESTPITSQEKARIVFGSRLLSPSDPGYEERLRLKSQQSVLVAGVLIPPQPEEPDNCCMSGCVNCVWERYSEDMEEWRSKRNEAEAKLKAQENGTKDTISQPNRQQQQQADRLAGNSGSMDEDGGGSEANWGTPDPKIAKDMWADDLFKGVPVGIREFMKQEKRLKERHEREGTAR